MLVFIWTWKNGGISVGDKIMRAYEVNFYDGGREKGYYCY